MPDQLLTCAERGVRFAGRAGGRPHRVPHVPPAGAGARRAGARRGQVVQPRQGLRLHHPDAGGGDLFVHKSGLAPEGSRSLRVGQLVEFSVGRGLRGRRQRMWSY